MHWEILLLSFDSCTYWNFLEQNLAFMSFIWLWNANISFRIFFWPQVWLNKKFVLFIYFCCCCCIAWREQLRSCQNLFLQYKMFWCFFLGGECLNQAPKIIFVLGGSWEEMLANWKSCHQTVFYDCFHFYYFFIFSHFFWEMFF